MKCHLHIKDIVNISAVFRGFFEIIYCILILNEMNFGSVHEKGQNLNGKNMDLFSSKMVPKRGPKFLLSEQSCQ